MAEFIQSMMFLAADFRLDSSLETLLRMLLAVAAGAGIGWDREAHEKPAGLRTHMLVSLGAAVAMLAALQLNGPTGPPDALTRVIAGVVGGIGFLGGGTIIKANGSVQGITTAASLWIATTIGIACGLGQYFLAFASVVLTLLVLRAVTWLEPRLHQVGRDEKK